MTSSGSRVDSSRKHAMAEVERLFNILDPTVDRLLEEASEALGHQRAARCLDLARLAPLSRRAAATSAIAGLIVGTRDLGLDWWTLPHEVMLADRRWETKGTPDALLEAGHPDDDAREDGGSSLERLGNWVADAAADARWGRPIDFVDLNDPRTDERVFLPADAKAGDRYSASFDPGCRVWVRVVERDTPSDASAERSGVRRGPLGSSIGEPMYHEVEEARWAWSMATDTGPIRLPGEDPGQPSDPFAVMLDVDTTRRLFGWAQRHGASTDELGSPWLTKADLWMARFRLGLPYSRPGTWFAFDRVMTAAVDGGADLASSLDALG